MRKNGPGGEHRFAGVPVTLSGQGGAPSGVGRRGQRGLVGGHGAGEAGPAGSAPGWGRRGGRCLAPILAAFQYIADSPPRAYGGFHANANAQED